MRRYPHLMNRKGHYYFRIIVPTELAALFHRKEVTISLHTKDLMEAKARCAVCLQTVNEVFLTVSAHPVPNYALDEAIKNLHFKKELPRHRQAVVHSINKREKDKLEPMLSYVFKSYLAECKENRPKTIRKKQVTLDLWIDAFGDIPLKLLGKAEAREFKQLVLKLPSNLNKRFKGISVRDIDFTSIPDDKKLSIKSINIEIGYMRAFINWAIQNGYYESANPFIGLALKETIRAEEKRHSFSEDQLKAIFGTPIYKGCKFGNHIHDRFISGSTIIKDSYYWIPLIALYSGARMQEICQLYVQDIKQSEDIWYFDFNADGKDKNLKNLSSKRKTPIHSELIELGLLNHFQKQKEKGESRLFSDLALSSDGTYSNAFSKKFNYLLKRFKIKTDRTSFHSFRHTFIDALREANVPREVRQALVGHLNTYSAHDSYGSGVGLKRLHEALQLISFKSCFSAKSSDKTC